MRHLVVWCAIGLSACGSRASPDTEDARPSDAAPQLEIAPSQARIDVVDGTSQAVTFVATLDGQPVATTWTVSDPFVSIDATGVVTAAGDRGGRAQVIASVNGLTARATVEVHLAIVVNPAGASAMQEDLLRSAITPDAAAGWQYPYDGTVFPRGLAPPELMWRGGVAGDIAYAHYATEFVDVEQFAKEAVPARLPLDAASWRALTESGHGGALSLSVAHLDNGGAAMRLVAQQWRIAPGRLPGWIYYMQRAPRATTVRLAPGAAAPDDFLAAAGITTNCVSCHVVSGDGRTMIGGGDYNGSTFSLVDGKFTFDVSTLGASNRTWGIAAVTPDGKMLVEDAVLTPIAPHGIDGLWDTTTGARVSGSGLDGVLLDHPTFSRDGRRLLYLDHATDTMREMDFDPIARHASNARDLLAPGTGDPIWRPTYGADLDTIVYARGALDTLAGPSDLYTLRGGVEVRLGALDGDGTTFDAGDRDRHASYMPYASPIEAGGYQWVVFMSRRTYGNRVTTAWELTKQLWIAALDPSATGDPSFPAFHLDGQTLTERNWDPQWAMDACRADGVACAAGADCCSGSCAGGVCAQPVTLACVADDDACAAANDCCTPGSRCVAGYCSPPH